MRSWRLVLAVIGVVMCAVSAAASGGLGIYGIVEKVVLEPSEAAPERIQLWGAFAYGDCAAAQGRVEAVTARRGSY